MSLVIRKMLIDDINNVQNIARVSWNNTYEGIIPLDIQNNFLTKAYSTDMMINRLNTSHLLVAEEDGQVVGFANFSLMNNLGQVELSALYLNPEVKRKGIGTTLIEKGIEEYRALKEISVDVEKENTSAIDFYTAKGFKTVKVYDDNFDGHILKTVHMILCL